MNGNDATHATMASFSDAKGSSLAARHDYGRCRKNTVKQWAIYCN